MKITALERRNQEQHKSSHKPANIPTKAWDFPLSRNEKVGRLYFLFETNLFETEMDMAMQDVGVIEKGKKALRSMLPQHVAGRTSVAVHSAAMSAREVERPASKSLGAMTEITNSCSQNPSSILTSNPKLHMHSLPPCNTNNPASANAGDTFLGETCAKTSQENAIPDNSCIVAGKTFLEDTRKTFSSTSDNSTAVAAAAVPECPTVCCLDATKVPKPCEFEHIVSPSTPAMHQTKFGSRMDPQKNSPSYTSPNKDTTNVLLSKPHERPVKWMAALGSLKVPRVDDIHGAVDKASMPALGRRSWENAETHLPNQMQLQKSCHVNSIEPTQNLLSGQVKAEATPVEPTDTMAGTDQCLMVEEETDSMSCEGSSPDVIAAWRQAVQALEPYRNDTDLLQLRKLMENPETQKFEHVVQDNRPVLVTAPHSIYLIRDGEQPHLVEEHTADIAFAFAEELGGTSLSWTFMEQRRSRLLWSVAKRRRYSPGALLDPRNRDPNYLSTSELASNPWCQEVRTLAARWQKRSQIDQEAATFHVDVHGCQDPPNSPAHITVGLGAMCARARKQGFTAVAQTEAFGAALKSELTSALASSGLNGCHELVHVVMEEEEDSKARFSGAWPARVGRHTQTQQAIACARFTHAVQLELSKELRRLLVGNCAATRRLASALRAAWARAKRGSATCMT